MTIPVEIASPMKSYFCDEIFAPTISGVVLLFLFLAQCAAERNDKDIKLRKVAWVAALLGITLLGV